MPNFKKGDLVRVDSSGFGLVDEQIGFVGRVLTIAELTEGGYLLNEDSQTYVWGDHQLEKVPKRCFIRDEYKAMTPVTYKEAVSLIVTSSSDVYVGFQKGDNKALCKSIKPSSDGDLGYVIKAVRDEAAEVGVLFKKWTSRKFFVVKATVHEFHELKEDTTYTPYIREGDIYTPYCEGIFLSKGKLYIARFNQNSFETDDSLTYNELTDMLYVKSNT